MIRNHTKTFWRQFKKKPILGSLNLLGIGAAIATILLIVLYIQFELSYDAHHDKGDQIFRIETPTITTKEKDLDVHWATSPMNLAPIAQSEIPGIESYSRIYQFWNTNLVVGSDRTIEVEEAYAADSSLLDLFSFEFITNARQPSLNEPNTAVISEMLAHRIFGTASVVGQTLATNISSENGPDLTVQITGVYKDYPQNSHFRPTLLISSSSDPQLDTYYFNRFNAFTYLLLDDPRSHEEIENKLTGIYERHLDAEVEPVLRFAMHRLIPLREIHLNTSGGIRYLKIYGLIALLILLIAGISYINIVSAQIRQRTSEIGVRKVLGSNRLQIIYQFLSESAIFTMLSIGLSVFLLSLLLPFTNTLLGLDLSAYGLLRSTSIIAWILIFIFLVVIAGIYPAISMSRFNPLKSIVQLKLSNPIWQQNLLVIQFVAVVFVLSCTGLIYRQIQYVTKKDLGFDQQQIILLNRPPEISNGLWESFCNVLENHDEIITSGSADFIPGQGGMVRGPISAISEGSPVQQFAYRGRISPDYFETMDLKLLQGRNLDLLRGMDSVQSVIINQKLADVYQMQDPIGQHIRLGGSGNPNYLVVVGVVENFHQEPLYTEVGPQLFRLGPTDQLSVKTTNQVGQALAHMESTWQKYFPQKAFNYHFLDEEIESQYQSEKTRAKLFLFLCILTTLISFNGLFALSTFMSSQRLKEIAIRKICGANFRNVLLLFSRHYLLLIIIAALPAFILSQMVINSWLERFAYRVDSESLIFMTALAGTAILTLSTIGLNTWRVFHINPSSTLKE